MLLSTSDPEPVALDRARSTKGLNANDVSFDVLTDAMPQMVWLTRPDGFHEYYNARWYEFTGMPVGSTDGDEWNGMFHEDDQKRAWALWHGCLESGEPYEVEYRLRHHSGEYRWVLGRALPVRGGDGAILRWIGTCTDIDDAKRGAEQNEILSRELSHRIKNIFAVINGLIGLSARHDPAVKAYAAQLQDRIAALGRAHEFARPHSEASRPLVEASTLHAMLRDLLSAYPALDEGRLAIGGDDVPVDDKGATPLALVFHELATNAAKYGALSVAEGRVTVETRHRGKIIEITWRESGGPLVGGEPARTGFGTTLADLSIVRQLGGELTREWKPEGLEVQLAVMPERLSRGLR